MMKGIWVFTLAIYNKPCLIGMVRRSELWIFVRLRARTTFICSPRKKQVSCAQLVCHICTLCRFSACRRYASPLPDLGSGGLWALLFFAPSHAAINVSRLLLKSIRFAGRYSVVCHVDIGIGETCREGFLQRLAIVKEALIPTPNFFLVAGDSKNRSGGPLDSSVGCIGHDLSVMGDGKIKKRLEDVARIAKEIQDPVFLEAMANMGQQVTPSSRSHVLVMEALIILLMPRTVFHNHIPFSSLRGVTWTEARHILGHPDKLCAAIARVDACNIPPVNLSTLQASEW